MARWYVCGLALAAAELLLIFATVFSAKGLRGKEFQGASRIPSQFSEEERVAMKEALKGEAGSPRPPLLIHLLNLRFPREESFC
jgi:carboxypeptidase PM20D1